MAKKSYNASYQKHKEKLNNHHRETRSHHNKLRNYKKKITIKVMPYSKYD